MSHLAQMLCHGCSKEIKDCKTISHQARQIIFCSQKCLVKYIGRMQFSKIPDSDQIAVRAKSRLQELQQDVLYSTLGSHNNHVLEELIFELNYVVTGHNLVTKQQRYTEAVVISAYYTETVPCSP